MNSQFVLLVSFAAAVACAGGSTMRVAPGDSESDTPVSLAPAPDEAPPDSALAPQPASAPANVSVQDTAASEQGYAPYGSGESPAKLELRRIGQWSHTGIRESRRMVIQDANAWAAFWAELGVGDRPAVDFTRDVVIAVAAGQRPTGGHEIAVTRVTQVNGELRAEVVETAPGPNCLSTTSLTQPVDVVVIQGIKPRSWSFLEQKDVKACPP